MKKLNSISLLLFLSFGFIFITSFIHFNNSKNNLQNGKIYSSKGYGSLSTQNSSTAPYIEKVSSPTTPVIKGTHISCGTEISGICW